MKLGIIGLPGVGKSTLFNQLTGSTQRIGNWPGVTVDKKTGQFTFQGKQFDVVDLPGIYSLDNAAGSLDEKITRDYIRFSFLIANKFFFRFNKFVNIRYYIRCLIITTEV